MKNLLDLNELEHGNIIASGMMQLAANITSTAVYMKPNQHDYNYNRTYNI